MMASVVIPNRSSAGTIRQGRCELRALQLWGSHACSHTLAEVLHAQQGAQLCELLLAGACMLTDPDADGQSHAVLRVNNQLLTAHPCMHGIEGQLQEQLQAGGAGDQRVDVVELGEVIKWGGRGCRHGCQ